MGSKWRLYVAIGGPDHAGALDLADCAFPAWLGRSIAGSFVLRPDPLYGDL